MKKIGMGDRVVHSDLRGEVADVGPDEIKVQWHDGHVGFYAPHRFIVGLAGTWNLLPAEEYAT